VTKYDAETNWSVGPAEKQPSSEGSATNPLDELARNVSNYDLDEDGMLDKVIDWLGRPKAL
jgi:hypothetical protein